MMKLIHIRKNEVNSNLSDNYQIAAAVLNGLDAALSFAASQSKELQTLVNAVDIGRHGKAPSLLA